MAWNRRRRISYRIFRFWHEIEEWSGELWRLVAFVAGILALALLALEVCSQWPIR